MPTPNPFPGPTGLTPHELKQIADYTAAILIAMAALFLTAVFALTFLIISIMRE